MGKQEKDDSAYAAFNTLRRHFNSCGNCRGALHAKAFEHMCAAGKDLTVTAAFTFDGVLTGKAKLVERGAPLTYLCPDISVHGASYSMLAKPVVATGAQDGLF